MFSWDSLRVRRVHLSPSPHRGLGGHIPRSPIPRSGHIHSPATARERAHWGSRRKGPSREGGGLSVPSPMFSSHPCGPVLPPCIPLPPSVYSWALQNLHSQRQIQTNLPAAHLLTLHLCPQGQSFYFQVRRRVRGESLWPCPVPDDLWTNQRIRSPLPRGTHGGGGSWGSRPGPCTSVFPGAPELSPTSVPLGGSLGPHLLFPSVVSFLSLLRHFQPLELLVKVSFQS